MGRTWFVNENAHNIAPMGNELDPFPSLRMADASALPGDTIIVKGPLHEEVRWRSSGTEKDRITIKSFDDGSFIDGKYTLPEDHDPSAGWTGPTGLRGMHQPLIRIKGDHVDWMCHARNSQGRMIQVSDATMTRVKDAELTGYRTAGVEFNNTVAGGMYNCRLSDGSNYNTSRNLSGGYNFSGAIKTINASGTAIVGNRVWNHYGNVITPSRGSSGISVADNVIFDNEGSPIYVHWANDVSVRNNKIFYTHRWQGGIYSGIVINNEEEFVSEGNSNGKVRIIGNRIIGAKHGVAVWGNEGIDTTVDGISVRLNTIVGWIESAIHTKANAKFMNGIVESNTFAGDNLSLYDLRSPHSDFTFVGNQFVHYSVDPRVEDEAHFDTIFQRLEASSSMRAQILQILDRAQSNLASINNDMEVIRSLV